MGKDGDIKLGGSVAYMDSWSLSMGAGTADVTGFGLNSKEFVHTLREWSGSLSGTFDRSDTDQADIFAVLHGSSTTGLVSYTAKFYLSTLTTDTRYFSGPVKFTNGSVNSAVADKVSASFDFQGSSNLSWTCSTAG